ncbi:hypothetical protein FVEN_g8308 [Fusarium venenatum]|uniref:Gti1/Pac2 family protein n=1 Tax=Fusarium venenatum TaxID=56646 RepID=A0A2L2TXB2_9HYPO|nr:uncharacterized protein FVRRES_03022 [Fusarium venenatum]KAG8353665.1 hypothetical protein FVEN_g8308 [Fusarium venenatum]KAH7003917.1 Gti1/Pac2 family-domain-containing protein [Fusarium venenatum]CEI66510.1 unnamed protein product [Fusarium venenatum]
MSNAPLDATYTGFIKNTVDALLVFEACLSGNLQHVARRPHDRERQQLITSGSVFVYEEHASGIKRWTDGVNWSPSRILQNFLVYREMNQPFPPGKKKQAMKRDKKPQTGVTKAYNQRSRATSFSNMPNGSAGPGPGFGAGPGFVADPGFDAGPGFGGGASTVAGFGAGELGDDDRDLVGSLIDSYDFKPNSLLKKTITITYNGILHHLVSYYTVEDVRSGRLLRPSQHPILRKHCIREELINSQSFRTPVHEELTSDEERQLWHSRQAIMPPRDQFTYAAYPYSVYPQYIQAHYDPAIPNAPALPNAHQPQGFGVEHQNVYAPPPPHNNNYHHHHPGGY